MATLTLNAEEVEVLKEALKFMFKLYEAVNEARAKLMLEVLDKLERMEAEDFRRPSEHQDQVA